MEESRVLIEEDEARESNDRKEGGDNDQPIVFASLADDLQEILNQNQLDMRKSRVESILRIPRKENRSREQRNSVRDEHQLERPSFAERFRRIEGRSRGLRTKRKRR